MRITHHYEDWDGTPKTPMDLIWIMIEELRDAESDLDYITTDEFLQLPYQERMKVWFDARELLEEMQQRHKELMCKMKDIFDHSFHQAVDLRDRLHYAAGRKSR